MTSGTRDRFHAWARAMLAHHLQERTAAQVWQTSTMGALLAGVYDGETTVTELLTHGDFGLGTFNHLDGEMVILDGTCYHLRSDGLAGVADGNERTPFAAVTRLTPQMTIRVPAPASREDTTACIDQAIDSPNLIHAIRISGFFRHVETRTLAAQTLPYPPLTQAAAGEPISKFKDTSGDLAGFFTPGYEQGIAVAGYHLHFLADSRDAGGHALDFTLAEGEIKISTASELHLSLPRNLAFLHADLSPDDITRQMREAEGG